MADDGSQQAGTPWPVPKFHFDVRFGDADPVSFMEVSGLDVGDDVIEYRQGGSRAFSPQKLPGLKKSGNVTMKKGVFRKGHGILDWFADLKMGTIERRTVTISLLDAAGATTMVWKLANAFPTKVHSTDLRSGGNEVAVDSVELAFEGISVENG